MRKIALAKLDELFERIAAGCALYMPVDAESGAVYTEWQPGVRYSDALNTVRSPKDFFFPQTEDLVEFKIDGKNLEIKDTRSEKDDFVIFGVRACDVKSIEVLDRVFLKEPCDSYYANRREHATIVSVACTRPAETCFCGTFGIDAASPEGDVTAWKIEAALYLNANTEKGARLMASVEDITEECDAAAVEAQKAKTVETMKRLPLAGLTTDTFGGDKTAKFFDAPEWASLSEACLGCGTCTFVCPTCQCYDIKEFKAGDRVIRYRCWDSCMYSSFTKMSAGQPRLTQLERFRQRFMHKLVYYPANNDGLFSCVGCGRCLAKCPISMNIAKVMKTLENKANG